MDWRLLVLILMVHSYVLMGHHYNYHFIKQNETWSKAQKYCRDRHTDLASVYDKWDMNRLCINNSNCEEGWIGLYKSNEEREWRWSLPGVEFNNSYSYWHTNEPNDRLPPENYVAMRENSKWMDVGLDFKGYFICYDENDQQKYWKIKQNKTWFEAQQYCRENHTDLISGEDQIMNLTKTNTSQWLIGLFRDKWRWSDGKGFSFRNWDELPEENDCSMITKNGRWTGASCEESKYFYCYEDNMILIKESKTWTEALYYCREHHYDLVHVRNKSQQEWVRHVARNAITPYIWLGLHYTCTLQFWFWVTNHALHYDKWADSNNSMDHCDMSAVMEKEGRNEWYKMSDENEYNFICFKT